MKIALCLVVIVSFTVVGCVPPRATTTVATTAADGTVVVTEEEENPDDIECVSVMRTGSRIPQKRCTTRAEREAERRGGEDLLRRGMQAPGDKQL